MEYLEEYKKWLEAPYVDEETKKELRAISGDLDELESRFGKRMKFGTGGLRGKMGAGTNRMNLYTVRMATQGLAEYIKKQGAAGKGVAVSYDSRHGSKDFSREAALCLNANGIVTYCFNSLRPTPELSFAVRRLGCIAGIMITASHNGAEDNGYKVYWQDGAQITAPRDMDIMQEIEKIQDCRYAKTMELETARKAGLYCEIKEEVEQDYFREIKRLSLHPESIELMANQFKIVYTPLHGTGLKPMTRLLKDMGFHMVYVTEEQAEPDGDFPTVAFPNPEVPDVFSMSLSLAKKVNADLVLATDPDADRLGAYVKEYESGSYYALDGNMTGILLCDYILNQKKRLGILPKHGAVVKTIVTTNMVIPLAKEYGVDVIEVLTGFKYIGEKIQEFHEKGSHTFIFGFEESFGCLTGTYARDKDGIGAAALLCEAAAYYRQQGSSLWKRLMELYKKYGHYQSCLRTEVKEGADGSREIGLMMAGLREHPPRTMNGRRVRKMRDYLAGNILDCRTGTWHRLGDGIPRSDVLYFELDDDAWCCVRPSGTEPKIKYYYEERL